MTRDGRAILFYDGQCGLCHRAVRFILQRDPAGQRFAFSPLQGQTLKQHLTAEQRDALPDTMLLLEPDGTQHLQSNAALAIGQRLGFPYRPLAALGRLIPRRLRDAMYDAVARRRHRWFARPPQACPLVPHNLQDRFLP